MARPCVGCRSASAPGLLSRPSEAKACRVSAAERSDGPNHPSGCAEERSVSRIRARSCLSEASSARPRETRAPQVARSEAEGRRQWGRLFFGYFLLARQKKVTRPPGRIPGRQPQQKQQARKKPPKPTPHAPEPAHWNHPSEKPAPQEPPLHQPSKHSPAPRQCSATTAHAQSAE